MKQLLAIAGLGLALTGCVTDAGWSEAPLHDRRYADGIPVDWWGRDVASVDIFYGSLAPYGTWGTHSRYGRVFLPMGIGPGWQPYSRGYWRDDPRFGRMFVSADPWGWATYHYGRWGRDARFGWFWVPDTRFGASWVDWRASGGWASWSPLPPPGWSGWGYGWGNDWWLHAPGAWVYRPGLPGHVRRGRHDWDGRRDRDWNRNPDRDRDWNRDRDRDWNRDRDRDWNRDRSPDRDRDWSPDRDGERVDRARPGQSPAAGFVRTRIPPPAPVVSPASGAPPGLPPEAVAPQDPSSGWAAPRPGSRPPRAGADATGGFWRTRAQGVDAPGPGRTPASPAQPALVAERPERAVIAPPPRAERPQRFEERAPREPGRSREPQGRDVSPRVADD